MMKFQSPESPPEDTSSYYSGEGEVLPVQQPMRASWSTIQEAVPQLSRRCVVLSSAVTIIVAVGLFATVVTVATWGNSSSSVLAETSLGGVSGMSAAPIANLPRAPAPTSFIATPAPSFRPIPVVAPTTSTLQIGDTSNSIATQPIMAATRVNDISESPSASNTFFPTNSHTTFDVLDLYTLTPTIATSSPIVFSKTDYPTQAPTAAPTILPASPTQTPTARPTASPTTITYEPGNLTTTQHGLLLSQGLSVRLLASTGQTVDYANGSQSKDPFHGRPDAGATFWDTRPNNPGGWIYVSNSEIRQQDGGKGGVGAITFDRHGNIRDYQMILNTSQHNCGGGKSPWGTWVSCEEDPHGNIYQTDPTGQRQAQKLSLGSDGGSFESFAYDVRNRFTPRFFVTEDHSHGALQRFTPDLADWNDPWNMLHGNGTIDYLMLEPNLETTGGKFQWTSDRNASRSNANDYYPNTEGIDIKNGRLFFVSKSLKQLYELDLDAMTYTNSTTAWGLFDGHPDQLKRIMDNPYSRSSPVRSNQVEELLYFTEEGGKLSGIHGRNVNGEFFTVVESPVYSHETTGLAFSPDGMHMYFAFQVSGYLFDIIREDGQPFQAKTLDVQYHHVQAT